LYHLIKTFGGLVDGSMWNNMWLTAVYVSVTRLRRKHGYCNRFLYQAFKWESVSMDFITQLPMTKKGHDAIVFVDTLTKMVHFSPTTTTCSARDVARLFNDTVFKHHGLPSELILDRDPRFTSKFWTELTPLLGTKLKMSTALHPQTDGQTERSNPVFKNYLKHYVSRLWMTGTNVCLRLTS
jgi:hypothetical protein